MLTWTTIVLIDSWIQPLGLVFLLVSAVQIFRGKERHDEEHDGKVKLFRWYDNLFRVQQIK